MRQRQPQAERIKPRRVRVEPVDEPGSDEMEVHTALEEWGSWCRASPVRGRAMSAEGMYNARAGDTFDPPPYVRRHDSVRCEAVNKALLQVPQMSRNALTMRYFYRRQDAAVYHIVLAPAGLRPEHYGPFMRHARMMVWERLFTLLRFGIILRPDNEPAERAEERSTEPDGWASYSKPESECQPWRSAPAPYQAAGSLRTAAGATGIAKQTAPGGAQPSKVPARTSAAPGSGSAPTSSAPSRSAAPVRRKAG